MPITCRSISPHKLKSELPKVNRGCSFMYHTSHLQTPHPIKSRCKDFVSARKSFYTPTSADKEIIAAACAAFYRCEPLSCFYSLIANLCS